MDHEMIAHKGIGDEFSGTYYVEQLFLKKTSTNKDYTEMILRDLSGSRSVKYWGTTDLKKGGWAFVSAMVEDYQGFPSIIARNVELMMESPDDLSNYIAVVDNKDGLEDEFELLRGKIGELEALTGDKTCSMIVDDVYSDSFFAKFISCPGSKSSSYGKQGGLLAQVVRVTRHADKVAEFYELSPKEHSILISAGLLCRIGAVDGYEFSDCTPSMLTKGELLGIPALTIMRVNTALRRAAVTAKKEGENFYSNTALRLMHSIVSAGGITEPVTKESLVLREVLDMDGGIADAFDFIDRDCNADESFTAFDPKLRRRYYKSE
jgi:23S rRNA maturation-related 3'-5' exoribonuclease YhaM